MVYSASQIWASYRLNDEYYYLVRQGIFGIIGVLIIAFLPKIDYHYHEKYATIIFFILFILLVIVLIPGIGVVRGGARSWIGFGSFSIQPAEFMKLGILIIVAKFISRNDISSFKNLMVVVLLIGIVFGLIMLEPDLGTGLVLLLGMVFLFFVGGIKSRYLFLLGGGLLLGAIGLIIIAPYRIQRITAYLDPWSDPLGSGFQTIQSLYALSPGGLFGLGLFKSRQKFYYLPEPQTDFIFAIIAEELGFIGVLFIFGLFFTIFYNGIKISMKARDSFGCLLALGIVGLLFVQFFINIGVVIGLLPVTGITLPFLSYGGSSLLLTSIEIGILLSIK